MIRCLFALEYYDTIVSEFCSYVTKFILVFGTQAENSDINAGVSWDCKHTYGRH